MIIFSFRPFLYVMNGAKLFVHFPNYGYIWRLIKLYPLYFCAHGGLLMLASAVGRLPLRSNLPPTICWDKTQPSDPKAFAQLKKLGFSSKNTRGRQAKDHSPLPNLRSADIPPCPMNDLISYHPMCLSFITI
jgi:hypothetical protein